MWHHDRKQCRDMLKIGVLQFGIRAVRPYKAWGWTDYATLHTLSVHVSGPRALGYLWSSKMSGRGRGNRRGATASPPSDSKPPDLANDFAEIVAALRESAATMRESNAARERERESHVNEDGSTAGNRVVSLIEFMKLRPSQFSGTTNPSKADDCGHISRGCRVAPSGSGESSQRQPPAGRVYALTVDQEAFSKDPTQERK
ncbi:hypothetical protein PIB30_024416 [Stylosanthes scabra]|uniref:Uncharacterized protein n=1 Tax=Stylosanthes scabra TaxID=79078 RepID=A0ABU6U8S9_9FABA|nr:hypothetical protein [Stylosanthes scabra]